MKIKSMFERGTVFSFEIFPPKKTSPIETVYNTLEKLGDLNPDFISVTYGAAGSTNKVSTCEIASAIKNKYGIVPAAHLPCINYTKEEILQILDEFKSSGIENILALRGDINPDIPPKKDFKYASELIEFIKANGDFDIAGACYPEGHIECDNIIDDIHNLKRKVDAGAEHLISQLFFDNGCFYSFLEKIRIAGINVPVEAGIMPVVNKNQIERMVSLCGASLPSKFTKMMQKYEHSPEAIRDAGIAYAIDQIVDLVSNGVDGIHIYTMNNPYVARRISEAVESLIRCRK
ncbi:MAG: methylenetetrahydrofolate reductase [NAD(P)H] [Oscillospiraceae bacterium]|nr:methylenetetrahydrofolate reductase [NAD(P)H] [Oscillospiraceae bacterium]